MPCVASAVTMVTVIDSCVSGGRSPVAGRSLVVGVSLAARRSLVVGRSLAAGRSPVVGRSPVAGRVGSAVGQSCVASDGMVIPPWAKFVVASWGPPSSKMVAVKESTW